MQGIILYLKKHTVNEDENDMEQIFNSLYGIVLTPFKENGAVNYSLLEAQVQKTANSWHLSGLAVRGSTGEFTRLTFEENIELMRTVKKYQQCAGQ